MDTQTKERIRAQIFTQPKKYTLKEAPMPTQPVPTDPDYIKEVMEMLSSEEAQGQHKLEAHNADKNDETIGQGIYMGADRKKTVFEKILKRPYDGKITPVEEGILFDNAIEEGYKGAQDFVGTEDFKYLSSNRKMALVNLAYKMGPTKMRKEYDPKSPWLSELRKKIKDAITCAQGDDDHAAWEPVGRYMNELAQKKKLPRWARVGDMLEFNLPHKSVGEFKTQPTVWENYYNARQQRLNQTSNPIKR